jgi:hypothetical protein
MKSILQPYDQEGDDRVRAGASEPVPGLAERALTERKHLGWAGNSGRAS